MYKRPISWIILIAFVFSLVAPYTLAQADVLNLPVAGSMVNLSPAYTPALIKGITIHQDNPFLFDFIVDTGNSGFTANALKFEGDRLVKYFFACLTIPEKDLWVNLSPYEKDRMIPNALGQTALGRDLLAQDYILKQLTASLIYPERNLGREFWDRVYAKAQAEYGTTQIPVNTFNKVWIVADKATVYEHGQTAFVLSGHLKVMLEEDYLSLQKHQDVKASQGNPGSTNQIIRQIILPELEKEVNQGKNFCLLRQIFYSQILATWYKKNLKEALLNQVYADKSMVRGVNLNDPSIKDKIYQQYIKAYKRGVFNFIKSDVEINGQTMPRKYFSGGYSSVDLGEHLTTQQVMTGAQQRAVTHPIGNFAMLTVADNINAMVSASAAMMSLTEAESELRPIADGIVRDGLLPFVEIDKINGLVLSASNMDQIIKIIDLLENSLREFQKYNAPHIADKKSILEKYLDKLNKLRELVSVNLRFHKSWLFIHLSQELDTIAIAIENLKNSVIISDSNEILEKRHLLNLRIENIESQLRGNNSENDIIERFISPNERAELIERLDQLKIQLTNAAMTTESLKNQKEIIQQRQARSLVIQFFLEEMQKQGKTVVIRWIKNLSNRSIESLGKIEGLRVGMVFLAGMKEGISIVTIISAQEQGNAKSKIIGIPSITSRELIILSKIIGNYRPTILSDANLLHALNTISKKLAELAKKPSWGGLIDIADSRKYKNVTSQSIQVNIQHALAKAEKIKGEKMEPMNPATKESLDRLFNTYKNDNGVQVPEKSKLINPQNVGDVLVWLNFLLNKHPEIKAKLMEADPAMASLRQFSTLELTKNGHQEMGISFKQALKFSDLSKRKKRPLQSARLNKEDFAMKGGIDLNSANMAMTVTKDAHGGVQVSFNPALIAQIRKQGVFSAEPMIVNVQSLSPSQLKPLLNLP